MAESNGRCERSIYVRKWFVWLGAAAVAIGLFVLVYRGPGRAVVRGNVGDVAAAMLVYAAISVVFSSTRSYARAAVTFGIATVIEVGQAWWHTSSTLGELTIGDTCDPWDIAAYAIGVGVALVWERIAVARCAACAPLS